MDIEGRLEYYDAISKEIEEGIKVLLAECRRTKNYESFASDHEALLEKYDDVLKEMFGLHFFEEGVEMYNGIEFQEPIYVEDKTEEDLAALELAQKQMEEYFKWWDYGEIALGKGEHAWSKFLTVDDVFEHYDYAPSEAQEKSKAILKEKGTLVKRVLPPIPFTRRRKELKPLTRSTRYD